MPFAFPAFATQLFATVPFLVAHSAPTLQPTVLHLTAVAAGAVGTATLATVLRTTLPVAAAVAAAIAVDRMARRRGEEPPGFAAPTAAAPWRRAAALGLLATLFYLGVFFAFSTLGQQADLDLSTVRPWQIFTLHGLLVAGLVAWGLLAYAGTARRPRGGTGPEAGGIASAGEEAPAGGTGGPQSAAGSAAPPEPAAPPSLAGRLAAAFRLREAHPGRELAVGLVAGAAIWAAVLAIVATLAVLLTVGGLESWLPQGPPELVAFIAAQPLWVRLLGSLSAGLVEETFFRGFLQPRVGIGLSSLLFVLAHWTYGEPFMLVGVTLLSLTYALLTRWRGSVWAAAAAHAVFDGVQLLILVPLAMQQLAPDRLPSLAAALGAGAGLW